MANIESDILVELNKDEVVELKEKYRKVKKAFYVYTLLDQAIRWMEKSKDKYILVTSPENSWREDGSIVIVFNMEIFGVFIFSFDETYKNVCEGLLQTKRLNGPCTFFHMHESYSDIILDTIRQMKRRILANNANILYAMSIEKALALKITLPTGTYIKKLNKTHAKRMNDLWPHKFQNSEKVVELFIENNAGYGLFSNDNDELAAWIVQGHLAHMNILQTEDKFKRKGYGSVMLKFMTKHIAESGHNSVATVIVQNTVSQNLFDKLGFENMGTTYIVEIDGL